MIDTISSCFNCFVSRKRHPATVQTPGRVQEMTESESIEPLVSGVTGSRLEQGSSWSRGWSADQSRSADHWNENFTCDDSAADKGFETQFVMEFTHLKMGSER